MDYRDHIMRAVDFMEASLGKPISLDDVAQHVGYSAYHFHRLFQAVTGETPMGYLRKRRLAAAAGALVAKDARIIDVAFAHQFASQEAFTRAFARAYGVSPGTYRRTAAGLRSRPLSPLTMKQITHLAGGVTMEPKIVELEAMQLVGMVYFGDNEKNEIADLWTRFNPEIEGIPNRTNGGPALGLCFDDDPTQPYMTYLACMQVETLDNIPMQMLGKTLPASTYAVFTHQGNPANATATYEYALGTWLPNSEFELAYPYDIEWYDERFRGPDDEQSETDICIPVRRKA